MDKVLLMVKHANAPVQYLLHITVKCATCSTLGYSCLFQLGLWLVAYLTHLNDGFYPEKAILVAALGHIP